MNHFLKTTPTQNPSSYFRVAWQTALAASLCLGLPAGLLYWLVLLQRLRPSLLVERAVTILSKGEFEGTFIIIGVVLGSIGWGILLSKISGFRPMGWLIAASVLGVYLGRRLFWIVYYWVDKDFTGLPIYITLAIHLSGLVLSVTFITGLAHGLLLCSVRSALTLALSTSLVSGLAVVLTFVILHQLGLHVGAGNAAMPKVTAICTMVAAITGGMTLGVMFTAAYASLEKQYFERGTS